MSAHFMIGSNRLAPIIKTRLELHSSMMNRRPIDSSYLVGNILNLCSEPCKVKLRWDQDGVPSERRDFKPVEIPVGNLRSRKLPRLRCCGSQIVDKI